MENQDKSEQAYTHVLQKVGLLKNFSVAKVVCKKEIEDLKQLIRAVAKDEEEYNQLLADELAMVANMHDPKSPIPGIIYIEDQNKNIKLLVEKAKEIATKFKGMKITKKELCFLIATIIKELSLTHEDFLKLNEDDDDD